MRIVLTGGGTGGHVVPFEPIIEALRAHYFKRKDELPKFLKHDELAITFIGVADQKTRELFSSYDVPVTHVPSGKLRRYFSLLNITDICFKLPFGIITALWHMWRYMPDVVVSKGGYGSLPVILAASFYRIPILMHESDVIPGLANSLTMKFASVIAIGLAEAGSNTGKWQYKKYVTGTPVRSDLVNIDQNQAKKTFDIAEDEFVLLIMGGSQGAKQINTNVLQILPSLVLDTTVIHLTGQDNYEAVSTVASELLASSSHKERYKAYPYLSDNMTHALVAADAVISRAGATTLAEITRLQKPTLLIPLDGSAADHQRLNARYMERVGAAIVLDPTNLGASLFKSSARKLIDNQELRNRMKESMAKIDKPDSAKKIASLTFQLASGYAPVKTKNNESE